MDKSYLGTELVSFVVKFKSLVEEGKSSFLSEKQLDNIPENQDSSYRYFKGYADAFEPFLSLLEEMENAKEKED